MRVKFLISGLACAVTLNFFSLPCDAADAQGKVVSRWMMTDLQNDEVPNKVAEGGPLALQTYDEAEKPQLVEEAGLKGLRFIKQSRLVGKSVDIPVLGGFGNAGQPFAIRMEIMLLEKPEGALGGLFQACRYGADGFRLTIKPDTTLVVEYAMGEGEMQGFDGKIPLGFETANTVELRFDGTMVTLLVNGVVDIEKEGPLPVPYADEFWIGQAAGDRYDFNGIISEVSILSIKP